MMVKEDKSPAVRITNQFHDRLATIYELKCDSVRLSIAITGKSCDPECRAQATAKALPEPLVATGVGPTRGDAFLALREAWSTQPDNSFPWVDWEAIRVALAAVRAI